MLLIVTTISNSQNSHRNIYADKTGLCIAGAGLVFTGVAFIPNGSEWTYTQQNGNRTITKTTLAKQPERVICFGIGVIMSISGIVQYTKHKH